MTENHFYKGRHLKRTIIACIIVLSMLAIVVGAQTFTTFASKGPDITQVNMLPGQKTVALANLQHTPTGTAALFYDQKNQNLIVTLSLIGLMPNSIHPAHIHAGSCEVPKPGTVVYPLNPTKADATGVASTTTVIHGAKMIPATGWYVNVHTGPGMQGDQDTPITCGNIHNPSKAQTVLTFLGSSPNLQTNEHATGLATLQQVNTNGQMHLVVMITLEGLIPGSIHAAHIHAGTCFASKQVLYNLGPLQADTQGKVVKTITLTNVSAASIPTNGWAINVHNTIQLNTQAGYNPILCGNVVPIQ